MKRLHQLKNLTNIQGENTQGMHYFGCDQDWYASPWQRASGCGPTTATTLLVYLQKTGRIHLPVEVLEHQDCRLVMDEVWQHVTPTRRGIYLVEQFCQGMMSFAASHRLELTCQSLSIDSERPELARAVDFIASGLDQDSPVAFLNRSNGQVENLEGWHWVTIVELEQSGSDVAVKIFDGDRAIRIDFKKWYETSDQGGALIYLGKAAGHS